MRKLANRRMGWRINLQQYRSLLACAYRRAGQPELAMTTLADAFTSAESMHAYYFDAELYRLQAELLLERKRPQLWWRIASSRRSQ